MDDTKNRSGCDIISNPFINQGLLCSHKIFLFFLAHLKKPYPLITLRKNLRLHKSVPSENENPKRLTGSVFDLTIFDAPVRIVCFSPIHVSFEPVN